MKYKLLKDTPWIAGGSTIEFKNGDTHITNDRFERYRRGKDYASETYDWISWLLVEHKEDFEEVKETPKPRWNVGDYVVNKDPLVYRKISTIFFTDTQYFMYDLYKEEELRDPTPEELSTYFR